MINSLGEILGEREKDLFFYAPLVFAQDEHVQSLWTDDANSLALLIRLLLARCGVKDPVVRVEVSSMCFEISAVELPEIEFRDIEDDIFVFYYLKSGSLPNVLGVLSHEIGLAFWAYQSLAQSNSPYRGKKLQESDLQRERAFGSLMSIIIGLGVPATNASHKAVHGGHMEGGEAVTEWVLGRAGGLSPKYLELLFGIQLALRNQKSEFDLACKRLDANQRAGVRAAHSMVQEDTQYWIERLGLTVIPRRKNEFDEIGTGEVPGRHTLNFAEHMERPSLDGVVFKVRKNQLYPGGAKGLAAGVTLGGLAALWGGPMVFAAGAGLGVFMGLLRGRKINRFECSDRDCQQTSSATAKKCAKCGRDFVGEIAHENDRLEALERYEEELGLE